MMNWILPRFPINFITAAWHIYPVSLKKSQVFRLLFINYWSEDEKKQWKSFKWGNLIVKNCFWFSLHCFLSLTALSWKMLTYLKNSFRTNRSIFRSRYLEPSSTQIIIRKKTTISLIPGSFFSGLPSPILSKFCNPIYCLFQLSQDLLAGFYS